VEGAAEDEDILEIPVFIRMEWETEGHEKEAEKRELAYWSVLGVGRIAW
jgi:dynactin-4